MYVWEDDKKPTDYTVVEIPADLKEKAEEYRAKLIEAVSETDDSLMEKFFAGEELSEEEIKKGIKAGCLRMTITPMLCGTAFKNKGIQPLLDAVVAYLPAPDEIEAIKGLYEDGTEVAVESTDEGEFAALAFKIMTDPFVGQLTFIRVYRSSLESGSYALRGEISNRAKRVRRGNPSAS